MKYPFPPKLVVVLASVFLLATALVLYAKSGAPAVGKMDVPFDVSILEKSLASDTASATLKPITVVNVWATWCGPCIKEIPDLNKLVATTPADKVSFVAMTDETMSTVSAFAEKRGSKFKFDYQIVSAPKTIKKLGAAYAEATGEHMPEAIPQHYIFKGNKLVYFRTGSLEPSDLEEMKAILAE